MTNIKRRIITGIPSYKQDYIRNDSGVKVMAGCGPIAALMLLAFFDRRYGFKKLISTKHESDKLPEELILMLRKKMKTIDVQNKTQALTLPTGFRTGLKNYINQYYDCDIETKASTGFNTLTGVFDKSVELINSRRIHVMLLDWDNGGILFPNHYVVVVGYRKDGDNMQLIVNAGWGDDFHIVDMTDKKVKPARLYWIEIKDKPDGQQDGHQIGPKSNYNWVGVESKKQLKPKIFKHFSNKQIEWNASESLKFLVPNSDLRDCQWK